MIERKRTGHGPDFLIIGAQKGGTKALHSYLAKHPGLRPPVQQEIGFFDQDVLYGRGAAWYERHFRGAPGQQRFESTPEYLYYPKAPERIRAYDPQVRLIALLREPVARAWSAWSMFKMLCEQSPDYLQDVLPDCDPHLQRSFEAMLAADPFPSFESSIEEELAAIATGTAPLEPGYVRRGIYAEQLQRVFECFDREQLLIIASEDLRTQTSDVLAEVLGFLGLESHDWSDDELRPVNVGEYETAIPTDVGERLRAFYAPHDQRLYELIDRDLGW